MVRELSVCWSWVLCLLVLCNAAVSAADDATASSTKSVKSPLSPAESLKHFKLAPGLKIELVAAEPEVIDPISIAFDEEGTLWAVEMTDYPNGPQPGQPPLSRIRALRDMDGDGRYETSQVFADKLLFATGVQPWKGGLIVTVAGEIIYLKDTDRDGKADQRQTWFRGFTEGNPQLRANHPRWSLDNRIYVANGLRGGVIKADATVWGQELPDVQLNGFDFRFNPVTGVAESISGVGQFGLTFDDAGHRFVCSNRNPCRQIILENNYLKHNPLLAVKDVGSDAVPSGADSHVYPLSRAWTTSTQHAGQFTAACGVTLYRGSALPAEFYGNCFTCEPTGNLVHREILRRSGVGYAAEPNTSTVEFLATADEWFRPVDLANGPDGALYVVDMYRAVIEHPEWVPEELKHRPDERDGSDSGRIYRIVPEQSASRPIPKWPARLTTQELVERLNSTDSWQAETAARLICDKPDKDIWSLLKEFVSKSATELGRLRAYRISPNFWPSAGEYKALLHDDAPEIRELGVQLAEPLLAGDESAQDHVALLAEDRSPRVRFQVALSLGLAGENTKLRNALAKIYLLDADDEWTRRAVLISIGRNANSLLTYWNQYLKKDDPVTTGRIASLRELAELIGSQEDKWLHDSLDTILGLTNERYRVAGFLGLCNGLQRRGKVPREVFAIAALADMNLGAEVSKLFDLSLSRTTNEKLPLADRLEWMSVLQFADWSEVGESLLTIATAGQEQEIVVKAIDTLATFDDSQIAARLLAQYATRTPTIRRAILRALLRNPGRAAMLLDAIRDKRVSLVELDPNQVKALISHPDPKLREEANKILAAAIPADRKMVLEQYQQALKLAAQPERGRVVFEKNCATCHQIGKLGVSVGPDIADSRTKTPAQLLVDILSPNQAIDNNFVSYTVALKDGRVETGFIATETAASITLRQPENKTQLILRQDIDELKSNGVSLMPEGLEKNITVEQMGDLISFIKNWRYLNGQVPIKVGTP